MNGMKLMSMKKNNALDKNILCSWSGGKDSCFALMEAIQQGYKPVVLLNVLNEEGQEHVRNKLSEFRDALMDKEIDKVQS